MRPPKPTEYKHGDTDKLTGRIFYSYSFINGKWHTALYKSRTVFGAQLESMVKGAKQRAIKERLPFDIDYEYLKSIATQTCPVFGIQLSWGTWGEGTVSNYSPTLDKIKPEWGYVKGNVCIISQIANTIKQDVGFDELFKVANWLENITKEAEKNVKPEQLTRIPRRTRSSSRGPNQLRIVSATGFREDDYYPDDHSGTVQRQDVDHSAQEGSGDSMGQRSEEMATLETPESFQNNGLIQLSFGWT